ncbi:MAG: DUF3987 domain-containing protein [Inquilinus sp.]|uniref:DUF3987 domain-containing protein n=1 Tax=Inquilinus sp. TaxID=1932117 RepID=UPI003F2A4CF2
MTNENITDRPADDNSIDALQASAVILAVPPRRVEIACTVMTAGAGNALPSKRFGLGADGRPEVTHPGGQPAAGTVCRLSLSGSPAEALQRLGDTLSTLTPRQALICAPPPESRDEWPFVTQTEADGRSDVIARTREHFPSVDGAALFALDFDTKAWPADLRERVKAHQGQLTGVLASVFPGFKSCAWLRRASSSAGVRDKLTRRAADSNAGQHRFYIVADGMDGERFTAELHKRLILAGWGYGQVTESGAVHVRSLVDEAASKDAGRLWFEGAIVLEDARLEVDPEARAPTLFNAAGGMLETSALANLDDVEADWFEVVCAGVREENRGPAEARRAEWKERRAKALSERGVPSERAAKILGGALERHELSGEWPVYLDGGRAVTVDEILDRPAEFHRKTCADPLEPEYGGGRNKAVIYTDRPPARIFSQAHGGIDYRLTRTLEHWFPELGPIEALDGLGASKTGASIAASTSGEEWPEPFDIFGEDDPAELSKPPVGSLPGIIERWARSEARRKGVSVAFAAAAGVAAAAGAVGKSLQIKVRMHDTWTEPAALWMTIVAPPGSAKSPIIKAALAPLRELDAAWYGADKARPKFRSLFLKEFQYQAVVGCAWV